MEKKSFIVHEKWLPMFMDAPDEDVGAIFKAMMRYTTTGDYGDVAPMHRAILSMMIDAYDADTEKYNEVCRKRREAVEKRWAKRTDTIVYGGIQTDTNVYKCIQKNTDKDMGKDKELDMDLDNDTDVLTDSVKKEDTKVSKKEVRHKYGQYNNVLLSDTDLKKLQEEFPYDWPLRIERLSEYIESKGAKYKNHLATIRAWARKDDDKKQAHPRTRNPFDAIDNMDWG